MLEKLPSGFGHALKALRSGPEKLLANDRAVTGAAAALSVTSPAFAEGGAIPTRYTADGEKLSPPLAWSDVPGGTAAIVLVVEDADSPTPHPLVHAIVHDLKPGERRLDEGALPGPAGPGEARAMGRNSFLGAAYLPPDPPPGHGPHRYAFQVFALDTRPHLGASPGRRELIDALRGHVLAKGGLIGTYERG
jgi:Raf kinase inhibitor-like YbhB/YbcL family protein